MVQFEELVKKYKYYNDNQWHKTVQNILLKLNLQTTIKYVCDSEEYIYKYSEKYAQMSLEDKKIFSNCISIAEFEMPSPFKRIKCIAFNICGNEKLRNERVDDIVKTLLKMYGRYVITIVIHNECMSFSGVRRIENSYETIISDWFDFDEDVINDRLLEIDFLDFSYKKLRDFYDDYIYSVSRDYIRYARCKTNYTYMGPEYIFKEIAVEDVNGDKGDTVEVLDAKETYRANLELDYKKYGYDYFIDDHSTEVDNLLSDFEIDEEENKWTLLELELEDLDIDTYVDEKNKELNDTNHEIERDLHINYNPEEMLNRIRNIGDSETVSVKKMSIVENNEKEVKQQIKEANVSLKTADTIKNEEDDTTNSNSEKEFERKDNEYLDKYEKLSKDNLESTKQLNKLKEKMELELSKHNNILDNYDKLIRKLSGEKDIINNDLLIKQKQYKEDVDKNDQKKKEIEVVLKKNRAELEDLLKEEIVKRKNYEKAFFYKKKKMIEHKKILVEIDKKRKNLSDCENKLNLLEKRIVELGEIFEKEKDKLENALANIEKQEKETMQLMEKTQKDIDDLQNKYEKQVIIAEQN